MRNTANIDLPIEFRVIIADKVPYGISIQVYITVVAKLYVTRMYTNCVTPGVVGTVNNVTAAMQYGIMPQRIQGRAFPHFVCVLFTKKAF